MSLTHGMAGTEGTGYALKDLESRARDVKTPSNNEYYEDTESHGTEELVETKLSFLNRIAASLSAETKGIEPITDDEKTDDSIPVSYTHLDVYKRQTLNSNVYV